MKNIIKITSIMALMIFSFYYTEKIALYVDDKSPLKKEIYAFKENNSYDAIDAIVTDNYIIPGLCGKEVDVNKSYSKMRSYGKFNENKIVYKDIVPNVSVNNNKDKIVISGNIFKKAVTILVNKSENEKVLMSLGIKYSYIDNSNYCINDFTDCINKLKIKASKNITGINILSSIEDIKSGDIIYLKEEIKEEYIKLLIKRIEYLNLKVISIEEHIKE